MKFNDHSKSIKPGMHAFLSGSKYAWLNYDHEKLINVFDKAAAAAHGTKMHKFAEDCITYRQKLPRSNKALNRFVNDSIGYQMKPEVLLYYSRHCFGHADSISFRDNVLRIFDLKTGFSKTHMDQLLIYAAIFCLEYKTNPEDIIIELRIYQGFEMFVHEPSVDEVLYVMDKIIDFSSLLDQRLAEEVGL